MVSNMSIDLKKLYEQDAGFKLFVQECVLTSLEADSNFESTLATLYAMYQTGVEVKTFAAMIKMNNLIKPDDPQN